MAKRTRTPERAVLFTKRMIAITFCWPLPQTATRTEIIRYQIFRYLCVINAAFVLLPLISTIYLYRDDPVILVKSVCLTTAHIQIVVQTIICARNYNELQEIVFGLQKYIQDAELWKKKILQQYTDRCGKFYAISMLWIYFAASFIVFAPAIVRDQKFPISDEYPFPTDFLPLKVLLFVHQSFSLYQCSAQVSMNGFIALLLWFAAARFEILSTEMENVTNISELYQCIKNQQILLRYAENVIRTIRYISLTAIIASLISFICNGVTLLLDISFENKLQFVILNVVAMLEVFMLSWPADHLMDTSTRPSEGIYGSKWYESSLTAQKTLIYIILRSQKPLVVSVSGVLPPISLNYFASYLSTAFSYFTALRVVVEQYVGNKYVFVYHLWYTWPAGQVKRVPEVVHMARNVLITRLRIFDEEHHQMALRRMYDKIKVCVGTGVSRKFATVMLGKLTPERVIHITWLSVMLTCCWPPSPSATKFQVIRYKIAQMGSILSATLLFFPLLYSIYLHNHDTVVVVKTLCLMTAVFHIIVQTLLCYTQYNRLQRLIEEMKMFCKEARQAERDILQEYIDKCGIFYGGCILWFYTSACIMVLGTLLLSQPFPTDAEYPFSVSYPPLRLIVFLHQSFVGLQCAAHVCMNCIGAMLLWFSAGRYKILMHELQTATKLSEIIKCVHKHQHIRRYATEVTLAVRFLTMITIIMSATAVIFCAITLISLFGSSPTIAGILTTQLFRPPLIISAFPFQQKQALTIKVQFSVLSAVGLLEVFMSAWPADHLMNISVDVTKGAYESPWYMQTVDLQKYVLYFLMPQRPVTVSVACIMPTLSLSYYCSYLSNAFSTFTSLRIILMERDED